MDLNGGDLDLTTRCRKSNTAIDLTIKIARILRPMGSGMVL
jgi:hypothetical protein